MDLGQVITLLIAYIWPWGPCCIVYATPLYSGCLLKSQEEQKPPRDGFTSFLPQIFDHTFPFYGHLGTYTVLYLLNFLKFTAVLSSCGPCWAEMTPSSQEDRTWKVHRRSLYGLNGQTVPRSIQPPLPGLYAAMNTVNPYGKHYTCRTFLVKVRNAMVSLVISSSVFPS